jgi:flagellar motor switch protein FliM
MSDTADQAASVRRYDFSSAEDKPARPLMPALESALERINDRFARFARAVLLQHLHRAVTVTPTPIELIKHKELLERIGDPSYLTLVNLKPMRGMILVAIDYQLVSTIVEARFGGNNRFPSYTANRVITQFELKTMRHVMEMFMEQLAVAWEPFAMLEPMILRHETNRQFASFAATDDLVIVNANKVSVDNVEGTLTTCIPYNHLEPLHGQMMSGTVSDTLDPMDYDSRWYDSLSQGIQQAEITLSVELGKIELSVGDLATLRPGNVFPMDRAETVVVEAAGVPLFRGQWGQHGRKVAVRIDERLTASEAGMDE